MICPRNALLPPCSIFSYQPEPTLLIIPVLCLSFLDLRFSYTTLKLVASRQVSPDDFYTAVSYRSNFGLAVLQWTLKFDFMTDWLTYIHSTAGLREQWFSLFALLDRAGLMQIAQSVLTVVLRLPSAGVVRILSVLPSILGLHWDSGHPNSIWERSGSPLHSDCGPVQEKFATTDTKLYVPRVPPVARQTMLYPKSNTLGRGGLSPDCATKASEISPSVLAASFLPNSLPCISGHWPLAHDK